MSSYNWWLKCIPDKCAPHPMRQLLGRGVGYRQHNAIATWEGEGRPVFALQAYLLLRLHNGQVFRIPWTDKAFIHRLAYFSGGFLDVKEVYNISVVSYGTLSHYLHGYRVVVTM